MEYQVQKFDDVLIPIKRSAKETAFGKEFIGKDVRYAAVPSSLFRPYRGFPKSYMDDMCHKLGGEVRPNGWCGHKQTMMPLFYSNFELKWSRDGGGSGPIELDIAVYSPKTITNPQDPAWLNFAYGKGFETPEVWRQKLRDDMFEKIRRRQQQAQEQEERRKRQAAREAQERDERMARERAWRQRLERERSIKLFKKRIPVCRKERGWDGSDYPRYFGYTEGHDEHRIQVRVNERQTSPGWMDSNFKPQVIWGHVDDWFIYSQERGLTCV